MKSFVTRTVSGIILILIVIFLLSQGGIYLLGALGIVSLIGTFELLRAIRMQKECIGFVAYIAVASYYTLLYFNVSEYFVCLFICLLLLLLALYVFCYPRYRTEQIAMLLFITLYVGVMLSYVYQVRTLEDGKLLVWLIFVSAWGSDTFAYLTGMLIGKHKLPSKLSPNKTIEGCIGGIVGAALIGFVFSFFYQQSDLFYFDSKLVFALVGAFGSIISQIGDLAASAIKRNHDIKDYGDIIPGHGGILDRFDSIIFVAPVVYYLLQLLIKIG